MITPIDRLRDSFRQLRWHVALRVAAVTFAALVVVVLLLMVALSSYLVGKSRAAQQDLLTELEARYALMARSFLSQTPPDVEGLRNLLASMRAAEIGIDPLQLGGITLEVLTPNPLSILFFGPDGSFVGSLPHGGFEEALTGQAFDPSAIPGLEESLLQAFRGGRLDESQLSQQSGSPIVGAMPVFADKESSQVVGVLAFVHRSEPWLVAMLSSLASQFGASVLLIIFLAGVTGTIGGVLTARGLVPRLNKLMTAAQAWGNGDFSVYVDDRTGDELGHLAQGLNLMAVKLENLLQASQQRSMIEERNRMARELHDSVKQRTFAASAELAAAHAGIHSGHAVAEPHLVEAERLINEVRQELSDLIQEILPVKLRVNGLTAAVRDYVHDCANQSGVEFAVHVQGERALPLEAEHALFRILQGALSNVARHSHASKAEVLLSYSPSSVILTISDNGRGFEVNERHAGLGLRLMRERAETLGGTLAVETEQNRGTKVIVTCPQ